MVLVLPLPSSGSSSSSNGRSISHNSDNSIDRFHYYYAYDILSLGGYNYTTAIISDIDSISKAKIVVAPSEEIALKVMDYKREYDLQYEKLIVLNLDGYGHLVDIGSAQSSPSVVEDNASSKWVPAHMRLRQNRHSKNHRKFTLI